MLKTENGPTYDAKTIAENFNTFFTNVGPKLAEKIPNVENHFTEYLTRSENQLENKELSFDEFEKAFKSLKRNKAAGYDEIDCNIVIDSYDHIKHQLYKKFQSSFKEGIFPDKLKIAKVTPLFKSGDSAITGNYRPVSVLPIFSKVLERVMYNRVYLHFIQNDLFYSKQFGFQKNTSTEHAILQLIDEILKSFSKNEYTLGVFIDLSKAFDTVNHKILLDKLDR